LLEQVRTEMAAIKEAATVVQTPPAVRGIGASCPR
jgi:hypothetical protein